ncbi:MAG TPA: hypothetical protein VJY35_12780 [Candidatus Eisenbacteria bacterium]|nr:hypothetical protein [Candidatus Eisenbacteria bacterium]
MTHSIATIRRFVHRLTPVVGLLLLVVLFVGGTHHHADDHGHVCAVCSVGHSPAVAAHLTAPAAVPTVSARRMVAPTPVAPRQARSETASSRAPPLA